MQQPIEIILFRQLSTYLSIPVFIVESKGHLLFFNVAAEQIIGKKFTEVGSLTQAQWLKIFLLEGSNPKAIKKEAVPLSIALAQKKPASLVFPILGFGHVIRNIQMNAIPIINEANQFLGAAAFIWEVP